MTEQRDIRVDDRVDGGPPRRGRNLIAVIGIDRYQHWRPLSNAVSDARGTLALFERLGFAHATEPLIDAAATQGAIQSLVTDDLAALHSEDSLVLFYAGHGGNRRHVVGDREVATGYLIPVDADERRVSTWVDLEAWLRAAALLPARHILVILDACHSGIALDPAIKWRDDASPHKEPLSTLNARRSRRIITSALEDQRAMDGGPKPGHSLFTGCLIEAFTHGLPRNEEMVTTGSELGLHLQRRVASYPHSQQTPDFGAFAFDARGEMLISLVLAPEVEPRHEATPASTVPTRLHLIDLDDRPGLEVDNGVQPAAAPGPEVGAEGALAFTAVDVGSEVAQVPDTVAIAPRQMPPWIARHVATHPVILVVLIVAILAILVTGITVAWNLLGKSPPHADREAAPITTMQEAPPPTAVIALETPDPEDVKVVRQGMIESIPDKDTAVKETEVIAKLKGYKPLGAAVNAMTNDLTRQHALLDAAVKVFDTAHAAGNKAREAAAQAEVTERRKLIATKENALTVKRADLDTYQVRAPRNGTFVPSVQLNALVAADSIIGKLMREPIPVATFKLSNTHSFAANGSVEISVHKGEQRVTCTAADVQPDSVKVVCPIDPELTDGTEVALQSPAAASAAPPEPPPLPSGGSGSAR